MGMPVFDQITPLHATILVPDIIAATAIVEAAVAAIIEVAVAVITAHTIPEEAILMANAAEATPGGGPIPVTEAYDHDNPDDTTTDHDLAKGIDPAAEASLNPQEDVTAIDPILQIANIPGIPRSLLEGNDVEQIKADECRHRSSKPSHKAHYRSSCQNCYVVKYVVDVLNIVALIDSHVLMSR